MYAITFDMNIELLRLNYGNSYNNAYDEIEEVLRNNGFIKHQRNIYFGDTTVNAVSCVIVTIKLSKLFPWFVSSIKNINMLRIEELNDLMPAIRQEEKMNKYKKNPMHLVHSTNIKDLTVS